MTPERWARIKEIFHAALERDERERPGFIAAACGSDEELRLELERLLWEHSLKPAIESPLKAPSLSGRTITHYRILEKLGHGGMGEVYRAEDTNLSRHVAIKVLPDVFAGDPERLARFEREAKVLATLSHPNIASIYGLEQADGIRFLVLELVEGEALAQRIAKGPLQVEEALEVCRQIADGMEEAHEKGVIHRDLKPANIQLTPEGKIKVLDFGLARAFRDQPPEVDQLDSPAITDAMTRPGVVLGTAAYMSPEQAKGKPVDKRTDIWAFGCVMYECLTGKKAFQGETITETVAAILKSDPDWEVLPSSTPWKVEDLLHRCLRKDPRERLRDIGDARLLINDSLAGPPEGVADGESVAPHFLRSPLLGLAATALAGLLAGMLIVEWTHRSRETTPAIHASWPLRTELLLDTEVDLDQWGPTLSVSPDGRRVVFVGTENGVYRIYQRTADKREAVPIPGIQQTRSGSIKSPVFSPDGNWIAFFENGKLWKVFLQGGSVQEDLCNAPNPFGAAWGTNGKIVYNAVPWEGLREMSVNGGDSKILTRPDWAKGEYGHFFPHLLPNGKGVLFSAFFHAGRFDTVALDFANGQYRTILKNVCCAAYSPTGHLVFPRSDGLYAVAFDLESMSIIGSEVPLARDLHVSPRSTVASFGISNTGTLVYLSGTPQTNRLVLVDWKGQETPLPAVPAHRYAFPRFSPAGDQLAVNVYEGGFLSVGILDLRTGRLNRIGTEGNNIWPFWTPDGKRLTFQSDRDGAGQWKVLLKPADGSGPAESLLRQGQPEKGYFHPRSWSPDGLLAGEWHHALVAPAPVSGNSLAALKTGDRPEVVTVVPPDEALEVHGTVLSRDGRWVAYAVDERGQAVSSEVYITAFPKGGKKWLVSKGKGWKPLWSPDGRHIFYSRREGDGSETMMIVDIAIEPEFRASEPRPLFKIPVGRYDPGDYYTHPGWDISPDGKHFVMVKWDENWRGPRHINSTSNFFEELNRLCPTGRK